MTTKMNEWAFALGRPNCSATIRSQPEDFIVDEILGFEPDGEGNHAFLHIRKRNTNTEWLAKQLAALADVSLAEVGYSGLKDRHAVTTQFFTVNLSGKEEPDWHQLESDELSVLEVDRHRRKLRRGRLLENRFRLTLKALNGECGELEERLYKIAELGVPNYFGTQRFGHDGANLDKALAMFRGDAREPDRHLRGLYLSAARSWLFNRLLSRRVESANWNRPLAGESLISDGTTSAFSVRLISSEIEGKVAQGALHTSGPLWGAGRPSSLADALAIEQAVAEEEPLICEGLARAGMEQARRALRLMPKRLKWHFESEETLVLEFALQAGGYATSVLRELVTVQEPYANKFSD